MHFQTHFKQQYHTIGFLATHMELFGTFEVPNDAAL